MLIRLCGLCGIVGSVLSLIMIYVATALSPWFRWDTNALSELGVGEMAMLFNGAVIIGGVLNFFFALGVREYLAVKRSIKIGAVLIMLGSAFLVLVGIFTISYPVSYAIVSLGYFIVSPVGVILIGLGTRESATGMSSVAIGVVALVAILVLPIALLALSLRVGFGVPEIIEALIMAVWIVFMGLKLFQHK